RRWSARRRWGGLADREANRPWNEDTIGLVASTTKGATAICAHLLAQRGELDLDAPVVKYWPEFGAAGKEQIRVRWLLSHQAGLPSYFHRHSGISRASSRHACARVDDARAVDRDQGSAPPIHTIRLLRAGAFSTHEPGIRVDGS